LGNLEFLILLLAVALRCCTRDGCASTPAAGEHPRLLVRKDGLAAFRERLTRGALPRVLADVRSQADQLLNIPAKPPSASRALSSARQVERRVILLAAAYLATADKRYANAAYEQMMGLGDFDSWVDPVHVAAAKGADLMTASACLSIGLGYDWTYDALTDQQRERLRNMLVTRGLIPYINAVEQSAWWARAYHNWNAVTNGGCAIGALAILGEDPAAEKALSLARSNIVYFWNALAADGGWNEGLAYWQYAMEHALLFAACLRNVVGTDDGVFSRPGVRQTGYFPILFTASDGNSVAFCDDGLSGAPSIPIFYLLASEFNDPAFAWQRRNFAKGAEALDLFWMPEPQPDFDPASLPKAQLFHSIGWAMMRKGPGQPDQDIYLAFKSGDLQTNHSHADLNSFVLVAFGDRLLIDPGAGAYVPGYFSPKRYQFYHASTRGHNTLLVNGQGQDSTTKGEIAEFESTPEYDWLLGRAGSCYGDALEVFDRVVVFVDHKYFVLMDDVRAPTDSEFRWLLHTRAQVAGTDWGATITGQRAALDVHVISPLPFSFDTQQGEAKDTILAVSPPLKSGSQKFIAVLYPRLRDGAQATASPSPSGVGVTVRLPSGRSDEITFVQRGGEWQPRVKLGGQRG
jgi:hypothetical protein